MVVGSGWTIFRGVADGVSGGVTDRGGGEDGRYRDGFHWWEDNIAQITLGADPNAPIAYAPVLEIHHPIMSMLLDPGGCL